MSEFKLLSHETLDELVDTDPIRLRDEAFKMRAEIERLTDRRREVDRLKARVGELTSLLNDPDRLAEHLMDLRAVLSGAERDAEIDRLADGGEV